MKQVFKFIFLFLLFIKNSTACKLSTPTVSLSGPLTMAMEELGLLKDKNLIAISSHHPIKNQTTASIVNGGIFLGKKLLASFPENSVVFYDTSRDLKKLLSEQSPGKIIEVSSRDKDPFQTYEYTLAMLEAHTSGCETRISSSREKIKSIKLFISKNWKMNKVIFFLGKITSKYPKLVISHDGPILWLKKNLKIKTYPSDLAYAPWSKKILNSLADYIKIGLSSSDNEYLINRIEEKKWNINFRGSLTPGIRQIYLLEKLTMAKGLK